MLCLGHERERERGRHKEESRGGITCISPPIDWTEHTLSVRAVLSHNYRANFRQFVHIQRTIPSSLLLFGKRVPMVEISTAALALHLARNLPSMRDHTKNNSLPLPLSMKARDWQAFRIARKERELEIGLIVINSNSIFKKFYESSYSVSPDLRHVWEINILNQKQCNRPLRIPRKLK